MTYDQIMHELTELVREVVEDDTVVLTPETMASDVPGWDSIAMVTIIVEIERRFRIKVRTTEISTWEDVGDLVRMVETKTA